MALDDSINYAMRLKAAIEMQLPTGVGLEIQLTGTKALVRMPIYVSSRIAEADPEWIACEISELAETIARCHLAYFEQHG